MFTLVSGGAASGKSEYAESLVLSCPSEMRYYIATMMPFDDECRARIAKHRAMRAGKGFETVAVSYTHLARKQRCAVSAKICEEWGYNGGGTRAVHPGLAVV